MKNLITIKTILILGMAITLTVPSTYAGSVKTWEGTVTIPTYVWGPQDRNPKFQEFTGRNIYPYPMEDVLSFDTQERIYKAFFLENEYLRVTVLPELGGHVHSVYNKSNDSEMFYTNNVVKPGLIGMRGAWISGGIEFNTGPSVHTVTAVSPVDTRAVENDDGSISLVVGHVERVYRTQWTAIVTLRPGRAFLEERIRLTNPTDTAQPYYFWNCTAVPNNKRTRFIYPMTLGTDHNGTTFFTWPMHEGKDISWAVNLDDMTSLFAYECDQDFFGSYDYGADRGIVSYADHRILPGKKAWTWGLGDVGMQSQSRLTDDDGPYNEVQTGPLRTQADFGLIPAQGVIAWEEWWYPVHGLQGYEFATKDAAVNVTDDAGARTLRILGTGVWKKASVRVTVGTSSKQETIDISPVEPASVVFYGLPKSTPWQITVLDRDGGVLASFSYPLPLPVRQIPEAAPEAPKDSAHTAFLKGILHIKQNNLTEARKDFKTALKHDPRHTESLVQLAVLALKDGVWIDAEGYSRMALELDEDSGEGQMVLSEALLQTGRLESALDHAYKALRDSGARARGFSQIGRIAMRRGRTVEAVEQLRNAVEANGENIVARNRLALALLEAGAEKTAAAEAEAVLEIDPLDRLAASTLVFAADTRGNRAIRDDILRNDAQNVLEVVFALIDLRMTDRALAFLREAYLDRVEVGGLVADDSVGKRLQPWVGVWESGDLGVLDPMAAYVAAYLCGVTGDLAGAGKWSQIAAEFTPDYSFPHRLEALPVLEDATVRNPGDAQAWRMMGHLLASKSRMEEARKAWSKAAAADPKDSVSLTCLAQAWWKIDGDMMKAAEFFVRATRANPDDPIPYRDAATIYASTQQFDEARRLLEKTLTLPVQRYDCYEQLCNRYVRDGMPEKTLRLLAGRKFSNWEGHRRIHELYMEAHINLAKTALENKEFNKVIEHAVAATKFPENLNVGRRPDENEAQQYFLIGEGYAGLGDNAKAREAWAKADGFPKTGETENAKAAREAAKRLGKM